MALKVRDLLSPGVLTEGAMFSLGSEMSEGIGYTWAYEPSVRDVLEDGMGRIDVPAVEREAESFRSLEM